MHLLDNPTYRDDVAALAALDLGWDRLADSSIVLSGASGMIGSFLVDVVMKKNLDDQLNCTITALARNRAGLEERFAPYYQDKNLVIMKADLVSDSLDIPRGDYVIHAASNTHPVAYATDPIGTITTNVQGTFAMLELAVRTQARRMCFLSTVEIYGDNRGNLESFAEHDMGYIDCNTLRAGYPESKRTGEALCQAFRAHHGLDVVIARLPRVYGPTMKLTDTKALSQFLLKAVGGEDIVLKSAGHQHYSYLHVADSVSGLLTCLLSGEAGQAYNIAHRSGDIVLKDLAGLVAASVGREVVFELPSEVEQRGFSAADKAVMDGSKIAALGWSPLYDIPQGIERTIMILKDIVA